MGTFIHVTFFTLTVSQYKYYILLSLSDNFYEVSLYNMQTTQANSLISCCATYSKEFLQLGRKYTIVLVQVTRRL